MELFIVYVGCEVHYCAKEQEEKTILEGVVTEENKGGIVVSVKGVRVFVPASQTGLNKDEDLAKLAGTVQKIKIIEIKNDGRKKAIGSIKVVAREEKKAAEEAKAPVIIQVYPRLINDEVGYYLAPAILAACMYLVIVYGITLVIKLIERRLNRSDRRN